MLGLSSNLSQRYPLHPLQIHFEPERLRFFLRPQQYQGLFLLKRDGYVSLEKDWVLSQERILSSRIFCPISFDQLSRYLHFGGLPIDFTVVKRKFKFKKRFLKKSRNLRLHTCLRAGRDYGKITQIRKEKICLIIL